MNHSYYKLSIFKVKSGSVLNKTLSSQISDKYAQYCYDSNLAELRISL